MHSQNGFHVQVIRNMNEHEHLHPSVELLYVLEGELTVTIHEKEYRMKREDVLLVNSSVRHSIVSHGKNILFRVSYDYRVIVDILENSGGIFLCNSVADQEKSYDELRTLFRELVYLEVLYSRRSESGKYSLLYSLLDHLIENFMVGESGRNVRKEEYQDDEKLQKMIRYVYRNFQEVVSLSVLAEQMFVSKSTLSRFFKKQTGIYFAEYVSQIRIHCAVNELLYSKKNITTVAMDCGFSNTSAFDKVFRENYGMSPSEYRNVMQEKVKSDLKQEEALRLELREQLQEQISIPEEASISGQEIVEIPAQEGQLYEKHWKQAVNIGSVHNLTLANVQYHLLYLTEQLGFTYARVWTVFSKKLMICDGSSVGAYNYDVIDSVLDFLVSHHIVPDLDFGKRPSTAVRSAGDVVYYEDEGIYFHSKRAWEALFADFVDHVVRRYGKAEVSRWIFEISRDPVHEESGKYYEDPDYDICNVYRFAYQIVKAVVPKARIGGLGGITGADSHVYERFFNFCREQECVPDFISFMLFPYIPGRTEDKEPYARSPERQYETQQIRKMRQMMERAGITQCPLHIVEWNNTVSNRNYLNDSCFRGTYICKKVSEIWDSVEMLCIWMGSDWVSSYYDSFGAANGGSGLLTKDSIRKPAFYAFQFLNLLGNRMIMIGDHYIVTKSQSGSYRLLCFNFSWYSVSYFLKAENSIRPQEMEAMFPQNQSTTLNLVLNDMEDDETYVVKKRSISQKNGSILDEWGKFQYETHLERADVKYLQEICIPHLSMEKRKAEKGRLHLHLKLETHEFALYHIYKESR
ncbi:MAG: helix-turn-helix domain-containing protein [Eubacterium sp.]|nr:helix-turn-helix domain-containing protein [Eubacterium sp.]